MQRTPKATQQVKYSSHPDLSVETSDDQINLIRNINIRKRKNPEEEQLKDLKDSLLQSFKEVMSSEIAELKEQNKGILESNAEILKLLQINAANYKEISNRVEVLETRNTELLQRIDELELQLNFMQKKITSNIVEIRNIPRNENEDLQDIVKKLCNIVHTPYVNTSHVYRRGKDNAPIVIEYTGTSERVTLMKALKKYNTDNKDNPLNSENLGISGHKARIYLSEPLTFTSKKVLAAARDLVKNGIYKYCWTSRGNILLRKEEGAPAIVIKSLNQITDLIPG